MAHIKKLVMHGFKSFPKKTELPFTPGINVILGPNGSGKSNVSDALCFVLGRLSIKSMRAAKASNLIFLGTKAAAPAKEASVELIFDNHDKTFSTNELELSIKRIVRKNGQSIYKINNKTKTRQEVLGLLAQAGIDPNGFNIILQGEIQNFVSMQPEERRKIIEEVAGISIYELRKAKSLKELEKTESKLKEIAAILRERTAHLNNLERERQEALRFQKLEKDVKKFKASILSHDLIKKKKQQEEINKDIENKAKEITKIKKTILSLKSIIKSLETKIQDINNTIQKETGLEQEKLNNEIANFRADIAGLNVKLDNSETKLSHHKTQKVDFESTIRQNEVSIKELQHESPTVEKNQKELKEKQQELEVIEEKRKKHYMAKSELKTIRDRIEDKKSVWQNYRTESEFLLKQIDSLIIGLFDKKTDRQKVQDLKDSLMQKKQSLEELNQREKDLEKLSYRQEHEILDQNKLMEKVSKIDTCPLCQTKITKTHVHTIKGQTIPKIENLEKQIKQADKELSEIYSNRQILSQDISSLESEISKRQSDIINILNINGKNKQIKQAQLKIEETESELSELNKKKSMLEAHFDKDLNIEEKYETLKIEAQEVSLRNKENLDSEISFKQRELERTIISLKQVSREEKDLEEELKEIRKTLSQKQNVLDKKKKEEEKLTQKYQKFISERDSFQQKIRQTESELLTNNNTIGNIEQTINNYKIDKAKIGAEIENLETGLLEFTGIEIIRTNKDTLVEKLNKTQETLIRIGSVNMRALEVYDSVKEEYEIVRTKAEIIEKEKESVMRIIHEIDIKKKKAFITTLTELNTIFARNFAQISTKGEVYLELENKKTPFEGGVNIIVKTGHGKYFDVKSLSGGEQTMVALSLIFAIQELKPYAFYILDEIDAALDKRNSERLAGLLRKYMQKGQYIVVTHNDEVITKATNLFGISMHEGISKIISLKI